MLECFLLLRQSGARWIPLFAVPAVLAGGVAASRRILFTYKKRPNLHDKGLV